MPPSKCNAEDTADTESKLEDDVRSLMAESVGEQDATNARVEHDGTGPSPGSTVSITNVPTKVQDGGRVCLAQDAFMLYSDDNARMMEILGLRGPDAGHVDDDLVEDFIQWRHGEHRGRRSIVHRPEGAADYEGGSQDDANENNQEESLQERKTRISFELHESVFVEYARRNMS